MKGGCIGGEGKEERLRERESIRAKQTQQTKQTDKQQTKTKQTKIHKQNKTRTQISPRGPLKLWGGSHVQGHALPVVHSRRAGCVKMGYGKGVDRLCGVCADRLC